MTGRSFVDSNVLVYAVDSADPAKQSRARAVLEPSPHLDLVVSAQVLGEFYVTVTRKLKQPVGPAEASRMVDQLRRLPVVAIDGDDVARAVEGSQDWQISYWDALIFASARSAGCTRILSEDLADGGTYGGLIVENPFRAQPRVSEEANQAYESREGGRRWDDGELTEKLAQYEQVSIDSGMTPNAVHSYWDYARRFLAWRTGDYTPRGMPTGGRPVARTSASVDELEAQARAYAQAVEAAGREQASIDTYYRHAMFFVRWLGGDFQPGSRLRRSR